MKNKVNHIHSALHTPILLFFIIFMNGIAFDIPPLKNSSAPEVCIKLVDPFEKTSSSTIRKVALFPVKNLAKWKNNEYHIKGINYPEYVLQCKRKLNMDIYDTLKQYQCVFMAADEVTTKTVESLGKKNRPNAVSQLAALPWGLFDDLAKWELDFSQADEGQRKTADFHRRAIRAFGQYLHVDNILTAYPVYNEKEDELFVCFEMYNTITGEVILHAIGSGSYAHPKAGSTVEKDAIDSGLKIGLEKLGLALKENRITP